MKRFLVFWAILLLAVIVNGQQLPEDVSGSFIDYQEPSPVKMYLDGMNEDSPWYDEEEIGADFWYGAITFDKCHDVYIVELYFTKHAERECDNSGFCKRVGALHEMEMWYRLDWNAQYHAYVNISRANYENTRWALIAYTVGENGKGTFLFGTIELVGGNYAWYPDYPVFEYKITPHITHRRTPGRRVGPRSIVKGSR